MFASVQNLQLSTVVFKNNQQSVEGQFLTNLVHFQIFSQITNFILTVINVSHKQCSETVGAWKLITVLTV